MKCILDQNEFSAARRRLSLALGQAPSEVELPMTPPGFHAAYFTFERLFSPLIYDAVLEMARSSGHGRFLLQVERPDPIDYYHRHFGIFHAFEFAVADGFDAFMHAVHDFPAESPADSVASHAELIYLYSPDFDWLLVADHESGLAAFYIRDEFKARSLREMRPDIYFPDEQEAASYASESGH